MDVIIKAHQVEKIGKDRFIQFGFSKDSFRWNDELRIDLIKMEPFAIQNLLNLLEEFADVHGTKANINTIHTFLEIFEGKSPKIMRVRLFESALIQYLLPTQRRWLYNKSDETDGHWVASRITHVEYHEKIPDTRERSGHPEHVKVDFIYEKFGEEETLSEEFYEDDIVRRTVPEILGLKGFYNETEELRKKYLAELGRYSEVIPLIGKQFVLNGIATHKLPDDVDKYGSRRIKEKIRDRVENKVVIDIFTEREDENTSSSARQHRYENGTYFWERNEDLAKVHKGEKVKERTVPTATEIPVHPFVIIFDLQRHLRMSTHVSGLIEYIYNKKLSDKLILPKDVKELIDILIEHKAGGFKDIIRGKSGGAVILLDGPAGVGKTLTAEVFAEHTERALYSVQASQLGLTVQDFEQNLKLVFRRAARWGAILLLDEADVYIHERGSDLQQNALVGIMLRTLEYHGTLMFMTTNRPDVVDDAIASRCIARIDYGYPSKTDQKKIWRVLADTAGIKLTDDAINQFVEKHEDLSGRDIKNILKLANLKAVAENKSITIEHIDYVSRFNPTVVKKQEKQN